MNKTVKRKMITAILAIIIGAGTYISSIVFKNQLAEDVRGYMSGFSAGIAFVGIVVLIRTIWATLRPNGGKEFENKIKDERLQRINANAMAITFRISVLAEAVTSIVCAFTDRMLIAEYLGFAIGIQLILYVIVYFFVKRKA